MRNVELLLVAVSVAVSSLMVRADALEELVPLPRKVVRTSGEASPAALAKVTVRTGEVAGVPKHLASESYRLEIAADGVTVVAPDRRGVRYAKTTLAQLLKLAEGKGVACCTIEDWPTYRWRGFMPDTARNFLPLGMLKEIVDYIAAYKLNLLHWHLTENYAWRLESKKYPQLQDKRAFLLRHVGKYYTQEDFRELVAYAADRGVTVMPEIDVPGHALAFRRAFGFSRMTAYGADKIVADLFDELCDLAPAEVMPFVHVGGDEVWKREMEGVSQETLALWSETLAKRGRTLVRWDGPKKDGKQVSYNENYPVRGPWVGMQWCGHKGEIDTNAMFDANGMYIETLDPFVIITQGLFNGYFAPWKNLTEEMKLGPIFCGWHDGFVGEDYANVFRNEQIVPSCVIFGDTFWRGAAADRRDRTRRMPLRTEPIFAAVVELENRVIAQRDKVLKGLKRPFHFLRQSNLAWRITEQKTGKVLVADQPGATVHPCANRDAANSIITNPTTVVMETWVRSPKTQRVGAWIGFTDIDRDHGLMRAQPLPKLGEWNRFGAKIELNGEEVAPPRWQRPGLTEGKVIPDMTCWTLHELDEEPYTDQEYFMREPTPITLRAGWNHVKLTLPPPDTKFGRGSGPRWVGTFIPLLGTTDHPTEVPDLEYSAEPKQ